jgi:hypothetical protein
MAVKRLHPVTDVPVDALDLRDAVLGPGTALVKSSGGLRLYAIQGGRARHLGTFDNPGDAWAALDALDVAA